MGKKQTSLLETVLTGRVGCLGGTGGMLEGVNSGEGCLREGVSNPWRGGRGVYMLKALIEYPYDTQCGDGQICALLKTLLLLFLSIFRLIIVFLLTSYYINVYHHKALVLHHATCQFWLRK